MRVELADCTDKAGLLRRFAEAFRFPDWFGHNWDALADCLTDLSWLPAPAYRVVLCNPRPCARRTPTCWPPHSTSSTTRRAAGLRPASRSASRSWKTTPSR
ncbi:barstar family protein [Thauera humireducens]|uniref:barstar family protein n=1 Tax=Thauera humireducens TaxID=1134435 RepID=UPI00311E4CC4